MAAATLPLVVINTVDNGLGQVDLVMNRGLGSVPVTGNFELATLRFRLKQATAGTAITFDNPDPALALSDIDLEGYGYMNRSVSLPTVLVSSANHAPDAVADQYVAKKNTVLRVSAPGATANDADIDGDPYWLIYYYPPSHGQLTLYDDGSFVYTPTLGYVGADAFQYQGSDGDLELVAREEVTGLEVVAQVVALDVALVLGVLAEVLALGVEAAPLEGDLVADALDVDRGSAGAESVRQAGEGEDELRTGRPVVRALLELVLAKRHPADAT